MGKLMLLPIVVALLGLLWIVFLSKKGSAASEAAKSIAPRHKNFSLRAMIALSGVWFTVCIAATVFHFDATLMYAGWLVAALLFCALTLCSIGEAAVNAFTQMAPPAAELSETLSTREREAALRHGLRWFRKFRGS